VIFPFQNIRHVLYCGGGDGGSDDDDDDDVRGSRNIHNRKVDYSFLRLHFFMYH
jgi:hypothetical protein